MGGRQGRPKSRPLEKKKGNPITTEENALFFGPKNSDPKISKKIEDKVRSEKKKKKKNQKKKFFPLKSFLNDFKAILRGNIFFRIFHMEKICLRKNENFSIFCKKKTK